MNPLRRLIKRFQRVPAGARPRRWPEAEDLPGHRRRLRRPGRGDDSGYGQSDNDDGGAAVREPRRPKPGPRSDAAAAPIPSPPQNIRLGDARDGAPGDARDQEQPA